MYLVEGPPDFVSSGVPSTSSDVSTIGVGALISAATCGIVPTCSPASGPSGRRSIAPEISASQRPPTSFSGTA